MKFPYLKFYVRDWISDPQLRMVSLSARGLWFECICLMHMAKRRGYLESANGNPIGPDELQGLIGRFKGSLRDMMSELLDHGIPSVEENTGIWFSRRMVKDASLSEKCSVAGKKGGGSPLLASSPNINTINTDTTESFKGDLYTYEFDLFWKSYPKKVSKGAAKKAWDWTKHKRPITEKITAAVEAQKLTADWKKNGGQFIPHPATWLRANGWENDIESMNAGGQDGHQVNRRRVADNHWSSGSGEYDGKF